MLVPLRDLSALTMNQLIGYKTRREEMGHRGREMVLAEFAVPYVIGNPLDVYNAILANAGTAHPVRRPPDRPGP